MQVISLPAYDPTGISEYLGLGRPIDFDKKPVRIAMMCAVAISVVVTLWKCSTGMVPALLL